RQRRLELRAARPSRSGPEQPHVLHMHARHFPGKVVSTMKMKIKPSTHAQALGMLAALLVSGAAQASGETPVIHAVDIDYPGRQLVVHGDHFQRMPVGMIVTLGVEGEPGDITTLCRR